MEIRKNFVWLYSAGNVVVYADSDGEVHWDIYYVVAERDEK